jgi:phosphoglycerate dehydrogenase-like enzyme
LKNNNLAGAAIDTWYQYPNRDKKQILPSKYDFHHLNNVILSPHTAGYTDKAIEENVCGIFKNIVKIYHGEQPDNQINLEIGY